MSTGLISESPSGEIERSRNPLRSVAGVDEGIKHNTQDSDPIDLETARKILETVRNMPETTFTNSSNLSRIGGYSYGQVKQAFAVVAADIVDSSGADISNGTPSRTKNTPFGTAEVGVNYHFADGKRFDPWEIRLTLSQKGRVTIETTLSMEDIMENTPGWKGFAAFNVFNDERSGLHVAALDFYKNPEKAMITYRLYWRGVRWAAANLLNWDGDFILPEQLDKPKLPPAKPQLLDKT